MPTRKRTESKVAPLQRIQAVSTRIIAGDSQGPETRSTILETNMRWLGMSIGEDYDIL